MFTEFIVRQNNREGLRYFRCVVAFGVMAVAIRWMVAWSQVYSLMQIHRDHSALEVAPFFFSVIVAILVLSILLLRGFRIRQTGTCLLILISAFGHYMLDYMIDLEYLLPYYLVPVILAGDAERVITPSDQKFEGLLAGAGVVLAKLQIVVIYFYAGFSKTFMADWCPISCNGAGQFLQSEPPERQRRAS